MYVFLSLAVITSLWLASIDIRRFSKFAWATAVVVFTLPNLSASFWISKVDTPVFFRTDVYRHYLSKSDNVLILPDGDNGNEMLWQAQTDMYFVMPQGMAAPIFREYERRRWPIVNAFSESYYIPDATEQLIGFLAAHHVNAVIVTDQEIGAWQTLLSTLGVSPVKVGGVSLYKLSPERARDPKRTSLEMRARFDTERFHTLLVIAGEYLSNGQSLDLLTAFRARELKLIPEDSLLGPAVRFDSSLSSRRQWITDPRFAYGLWLSSWPDHRVAVGEYVWYPAARPMIEKLRGIGGEIYYPFPDKYLGTEQSHPGDYGFLLVILTREQLGPATELLRNPATRTVRQTFRRDDSAASATR
jgi:hypothetical protein